MSAALVELLGFTETTLTIYFVVLLRVGAAMALLPVVGERTLSQRVRLVITLVFTAIVTPAVYDSLAAELARETNYALTFITEIGVGLAIGFSLRLFVLALQVAGAMAAQSTSLSQIFGAAGVDPQPAIGHLLVVSGLALAVTVGLHVKIAQLLIYSYDVIHPNLVITATDFSTWGVGNVVRSFNLAFSIAAPFVLASLIYNIALGVINRAMPQLMVSFVGAPAVTAGGLILLFVSMPLMLSVWDFALNDFLANPFAVDP